MDAKYFPSNVLKKITFLWAEIATKNQLVGVI